MTEAASAEWPADGVAQTPRRGESYRGRRQAPSSDGALRRTCRFLIEREQ